MAAPGQDHQDDMSCRIWEIYQVDVPLHRFFEAPTVAALAEKLERKLIELVESLSEDEARRWLAN